MTKEEIIVFGIAVLIAVSLYYWEKRRCAKEMRQIDVDCEKASAMVRASMKGMSDEERLRMYQGHDKAYKKAFDKAYREVRND